MKNKHSFKVNDRVGYDDEFDPAFEEEPVYGTIVSILEDGQLSIKWDLEYLNKPDANTPVDPKRLLLEKELKVKYSALEKEFNKLEKKVKSKLKEAGKLLKEANKIAKKSGRNLADLNAVGLLYDAMDSCGWSTSSLNC